MDKKTKSSILKTILILPLICAFAAITPCAIFLNGNTALYIMIGVFAFYAALAVIFVISSFMRIKRQRTRCKSTDSAASAASNIVACDQDSSRTRNSRNDIKSETHKAKPAPVSKASSNYSTTAKTSHKPKRKTSIKSSLYRHFSLIFLIVMLGLFVGGLVFAACRIYIGMGVCLGSFVGIIIICAIIASISSRPKKRGKDDFIRDVGVCTYCGDADPYDKQNRGLYKLLISIGTREFTTFSKTCYEIGDRIEIEYLNDCDECFIADDCR